MKLPKIVGLLGSVACLIACGGSGVNSGPSLKKVAECIRSNYDEASGNGDMYARRLTSGYLLDGKKGNVWVYAPSQAPADYDYFCFTAAVDFGPYWLQAYYSFSSDYLDENKGLPGYVSVTDTELSLFHYYSGSQSGLYSLKQDFSSSSTVLLKYYKGVADQATAEKNAALVIDRGLSYVSSFMKNCGTSIKDLGFANY